MTWRRPLSFKQKSEVLDYWMRQTPRLTRSSLIVLSQLIKRQNPTTGRCNPSVARIMKDTGLGERGVRKAFGDLEAGGAVKSSQASPRSTKQFLIYSVEELKAYKQQAR